jgi:PPP family 3-phenylpropionic acid transporter
LRLALFYAGLLIVTGVQVPFFPLWLESKGLDARAIGFILAAPIAVRLFAVPIINRLADSRGDIRRALIVASLASVAGFTVVGLVNGFVAILLAVAIAAVFFTPIGALADAYAVKGLEPLGRPYGPVRLWGSLAFLVATIGAGALLTVVSTGHVIWIIVAALALMAWLAFLLVPLQQPPGEKPFEAHTVEHLWTSPRFLVIAAAASLVQSSHAVYYGFSAVDWTAKEFSGAVIGILWAIGVGAEILLFAFSGRLALSPIGLIALGAAGALVRWIAMGLDPPAVALPALQCLHALSFGATHLGSVLFAARAAHTQQAATAQADFSTILALGAVSATALSGVLYAALGDRAYLAMAAMAAMACVLLVMGGRLRR